MGNVLRALQKQGQQEPEDQPKIHVISSASAAAEKAAQSAHAKTDTVGQDTAPAPAAAESSAPKIAPATVQEDSEDRQTVSLIHSEPPANPENFSPLLLAHHKPRSLQIEQIRQLRTALVRQAGKHAMRVMVTSAQPREGKSVTSSNLAYCFAEIAQKRTLLIDADLRRGTVAELFGIEGKNGLASLLSRRCSAEQVLVATHRPNFDILPAGRIDPNTVGELLSSELAHNSILELMRQYDHVIIDSPPAQGLADAGLVGRWASMALLAVRIRRTPRAAVQLAIKHLNNAGVNVAGVVALDSEATRHKYYRYSAYDYYD